MKVTSLLLFTCLSLHPMLAQDVFNDASLIIQSGVEVTTDGSWNNTGFIINNGSITVTRDWVNSFVYQGLGSVALKGSDQAIQNNRQSFYTLSVQGGGIKALSGSCSIDGLLNLQDGIVRLTDQDSLRLRPNATVSGGSSISFVEGGLIALGTGYKFFPVGRSGNYHPVELLNVTGIAPEVEVRVQDNFPPVTSSLPATPFADIYWNQTVVSGGYDGSPVTVQYHVPDDIASERLVMLEGTSLVEPFTARETTLQRSTDLDKIESRNSLTGNIIALAALTVDPPREHYMSTTLSPHARNPENRTIRVFGDHVTTTDFRFQVFNRWGVAVYETSSAGTMMNEGWDGRQNGNMLQSGVYPYALSYVDTSGKAVKRTGFITILE